MRLNLRSRRLIRAQRRGHVTDEYRHVECLQRWSRSRPDREHILRQLRRSRGGGQQADEKQDQTESLHVRYSLILVGAFEGSAVMAVPLTCSVPPATVALRVPL